MSTTAASPAPQQGHALGTAPVFLASICTILGAIMFLRFGYSVAHAGLMGTLLIILLGHLVTVPTALAVAEIATNRKVEGGGLYFIISRSFGTTIGGAIGVALYLSQAFSVAFYMIAFAESFQPLAPWFQQVLNMPFDARMISVPATLFLIVLVFYRGLDLGVAALWIVAVILCVAIVMFFVGKPLELAEGQAYTGFLGRIEERDSIMVVFAVVFPAFTGMAAGVGLSGDLKNPRKSLPLGILAATVVGFLIYAAEAVKLAYSASPEQLASDQLIMTQIVAWGPIIPIGLASATISSAIGSILVAPRTLQAMGKDRILPSGPANAFLRAGHGSKQEPRNAMLVTGGLALVTVLLGSVDFVARIISMFFMVTYGSLCAISFLEHFSARPDYRPSFRSRWYISLIGAVMCLFLMFQMDPFYAFLAVLIMAGIYRMIQATRISKTDDIADLFRGAFSQATRYMQIRLQQADPFKVTTAWTPSIIMIDDRTFERTAPFQLLTWICHRYGFGTYLHFIKGQLDAVTYRESRVVLARLIRTTQRRKSAIYVDTLVSPSLQTALAQTLQLPGVSGVDNNTILFAISKQDEDPILEEMLRGSVMASSGGMNSMVLRHGEKFFANRANIHIWLTWHDYQNANMMILLAYIILGHKDWARAEISIHAAFPTDQAEEQTVKLRELISTGRIPVTERRIQIHPTDGQVDFEELVSRRSAQADLVILGFTKERLENKGIELFRRHPDLGDVLFVAAQEQVKIE